jgi:beta-fructofuranosidase
VALVVPAHCSDDPNRSERDQALARAQASVNAAAERVKADHSRPVYHLLPPANWSNDPNGPVYFQGKFHLFYQHNPYGDTWGNMHWGHFRSADLVHWEDLPIALWPSKTRGEEQVFSGCAAVTNKNRLMLFYTSIGNRLPEQWAAISEDDDLIKWKKHPANPILTEKLHGDSKVFEWRDPFLFTHAGQTYIVCGGNLNQSRGGEAIVSVYRATNDELTSWTYLGVLFKHPDRDVKNIECPLFFPLGNKWILVVSQGRPVQYFVGDLDTDSMRFKPQTRGVLDYGNYYAPNCLADGQGRRILWGWVPDFPGGAGWNGCFTLPRVLKVEDDGALGQIPTPELSMLGGERTVTPDVTLDGEHKLPKSNSDALEIKLVVDLSGAQQAGVRLPDRSKPGYFTVALDVRKLDVEGVVAPLPPALVSKPVELRIFIDHSVVEVYAGGRIVVTRVIPAGSRNEGISLWARGGAAKFSSVECWPMRSIWSGGSRRSRG